MSAERAINGNRVKCCLLRSQSKSAGRAMRRGTRRESCNLRLRQAAFTAILIQAHWQRHAPRVALLTIFYVGTKSKIDFSGKNSEFKRFFTPRLDKWGFYCIMNKQVNNSESTKETWETVQTM